MMELDWDLESWNFEAGKITSVQLSSTWLGQKAPKGAGTCSMPNSKGSCISRLVNEQRAIGSPSPTFL